MSSAEVFAEPTIERARAGLGLSEELAAAIRRSSREAPDRPHPVRLRSLGGVTIYVGAEGFAWWLTQWDSARVAAGVCEELPAESAAAVEPAAVVEAKPVSRWPRWWPWR